MKIRTALILSLFFLTRSALAAPDALAPPICKELVKQPTQYQTGWILGYLSGINAIQIMHAVNEKRDGPHSLTALESPDQVITWIKDHCKKNPEHDFSYAGFGLWMQIAAKTQRENKP